MSLNMRIKIQILLINAHQIQGMVYLWWLAEIVHILLSITTRTKVMYICPEIEWNISIFGSLHATMR